MSHTSVVRFVILFAGTFLFSGVARGEGIRVFATGSGSYLFSDKFFVQGGNAWRSNYATGGKITLGLERTMNSVIGIEGAYAYGRNNLRLTDLQANEEAGYGVRVQRASANLVLHSPVKILGLQPYGTVGLEVTHFAPTSEAKARALTEGFAGDPALLEPSSKLGFNAGGGIKWYVLPAFALRLDLRNHATGTPRFGLSESRFPITGTTNNLELSAGFTLHFGD